jgi:hypothetical protein
MYSDQIYMIQDTSHENGRLLSGLSLKFRSCFMWKYFAEYFPIKLHRTVELAPSFVHNGVPPPQWNQLDSRTKIWKLMFWWYYLLQPTVADMKPTGIKYVFGYHPHGIIGMGVIGGITSDGAGWSKLFPGIPVRALTLTNNFVVPFYREYLKLLGVGSVAKRSCLALLQNNQPICLVLGGAQESLLARPGTMDLILKKRLGFVKVAMQAEGPTSLVPILAFGENDVYNQVDNQSNSILFKVQTSIKKILGFTLPLMHARGVFNYDVGIMPYRRPINIVVGRPVPVPHKAEPSSEELQYYQSLYIAELQRVFDENKSKFFVDYSDGDKDVSSFELRLVE